MDYIDVYKKRLNRYGLDYQSRIQGQRERDFENYLLKSIYRVDFEYDNMYVPATLERYKQDYTETQCYLLTRRDCIIPNGTMLNIESQNGNKQMWMVWWVEQTEASGYNRYIVLKMTQMLTLRDPEGNEHRQWAYFAGPGTSAISDAIKSSSGEAIYKENNNLHMFITSYDQAFVREAYLEIKKEEANLGYIISEVDFVSTPGIAYISVDPSYVRDQSEKPVQKEGDNSAEFFWLNGGK